MIDLFQNYLKKCNITKVFTGVLYIVRLTAHIIFWKLGAVHLESNCQLHV